MGRDAQTWKTSYNEASSLQLKIHPNRVPFHLYTFDVGDPGPIVSSRPSAQGQMMSLMINKRGGLLRNWNSILALHIWSRKQAVVTL